MKDLMKLANECMKELDAIGIKYGNIVEWEINTRAKKRWGQCCHKGGNNYSINISIRLLDDKVDDIATKTTILHELLHSVKECVGHGTEWKRYAYKVNKAYGYNIKRTTSYEEKGIERVVTPKMVKHRFICQGCGMVLERMKESSFTKNYKDYTCGRCHSHFTKEF